MLNNGMKLTIAVPDKSWLDAALATAQSYIHQYGHEERNSYHCVIFAPPHGFPQTHITCVWGNKRHIRVRVITK